MVRDRKTEIRPNKSTEITQLHADLLSNSREVVIVNIPYQDNEDTAKAVCYDVLMKILGRVIPIPIFVLSAWDMGRLGTQLHR